MGQTEAQADRDSTDAWVHFGFKTLVALGAAFILAAVAFSVSGAVIASGIVTVEGSYQTVQHRDGGIIAAILVKNGALVKRNDVLIRLDATAARAALGVTRARINELTIQTARLEAELAGASTIRLPAPLQRHINEPGLKAIIASQRSLFSARRNAQTGEQDLLAQRIRQLEDQLHGLQSQYKARAKEARLNQQSLKSIRKLFDKGYASQQRLVTLERDAARLTGDRGRLKSEVARARSAIIEARLQLAQSKKTYTQSIVDELRKVRMTLSELRQTRKTQAAKLDRIDIRAPRSGFVHALAVHTVGGVIAPGAALAQIIPVGRALLIEARIHPKDVDKVRIGQTTTIRFPAFNARRTPALKGVVKSISAAQLNDPRSGSYFSILVSLGPEELKKLGNAQRLIPGMPAEVFIETTPRSLLSYFLKPLGDAVAHSMR